MSLLARVTEEPRGEEGVAVAAVDGEIDASNTLQIGDVLRSMLTNRSTALVVDLTGTTYLDSAAITLFFGLAGDLRQRQQRLLLVVPGTASIARAIGITGLDSAVPVHATRDAALADAA
jgi:anti-anti-sigma factor